MRLLKPLCLRRMTLWWSVPLPFLFVLGWQLLLSAMSHPWFSPGWSKFQLKRGHLLAHSHRWQLLSLIIFLSHFVSLCLCVPLTWASYGDWVLSVFPHQEPPCPRHQLKYSVTYSLKSCSSNDAALESPSFCLSVSPVSVQIPSIVSDLQKPAFMKQFY